MVLWIKNRVSVKDITNRKLSEEYKDNTHLAFHKPCNCSIIYCSSSSINVKQYIFYHKQLFCMRVRHTENKDFRHLKDDHSQWWLSAYWGYVSRLHRSPLSHNSINGINAPPFTFQFCWNRYQFVKRYKNHRFRFDHSHSTTFNSIDLHKKTHSHSETVSGRHPPCLKQTKIFTSHDAS